MVSTVSASLSTSGNIRAFVLAGKAFFTLQSKASGARFTFKVQKGKKADAPHFVSVLTGSDNTENYRFFGTIFADGNFRHSARNAKVSADAPSAMGFSWFWNNLQRGALNSLDFFHAGKCGRCGRMLTVPDSIESGYGPECAGKMGM